MASHTHNTPDTTNDPTMPDAARARTAAKATAKAKATAAAIMPPVYEDTGDPDNPDDDAVLREHIAALVPESMRTAGWELLGELCIIVGVNPSPDVDELLTWKHFPGGVVNRQQQPDSVQILTYGGKKLRYPFDDDTLHQFALIFGLYKVDKATGQSYRQPLPPSLILPREMVTGVSKKVEHTYPEGYLKRDRTPAEVARDAARRRADQR